MKHRINILAAVLLAVVMLLIAIFPVGAGTTRTPFTGYTCIMEAYGSEERCTGPIVCRGVDAVNYNKVLSTSDMVAGLSTATFTYIYNDQRVLSAGHLTSELVPDAYDGNGGWSGHEESMWIVRDEEFFYISNVVMHGWGDLASLVLYAYMSFLSPDESFPPGCEDALWAAHFDGYILDPAGK